MFFVDSKEWPTHLYFFLISKLSSAAIKLREGILGPRMEVIDLD